MTNRPVITRLVTKLELARAMVRASKAYNVWRKLDNRATEKKYHALNKEVDRLRARWLINCSNSTL